MSTSNKLVDLIREIVKDELLNKDDATICLVQSVNADGTLNIQLLSDIETILENIPNNSAYTFESGDYAVLYKLDNNLANAFVMSKVTDVPPELVKNTYIMGGGSSSGGGSMPPNYVTTDTAQIISGVKTFSSGPVLNNGVALKGKGGGSDTAERNLIGVESGDIGISLGDVTSNIIVSTVSDGNFRPSTSNYTNLGTSNAVWKNLFLGGFIGPSNASYGLALPSTSGWTANKTIATVDDLSGYLPLSGGTMSGVINTPTNSPAINLRANHNDYNGIISYRTSGNEAVCFDVKNRVTSFIFRTRDSSGTAGTTSEWNQVTPSMQIKDQRVAINKLITNGNNANYNLEVNGSVGATTYTIGNAATMQYNSTTESIDFIFG